MRVRIHSNKVLLLFCCIAIAAASCKRWTERGAKGIGLLPGAPARDASSSLARPANPFTRYAPGLLARPLYRAAPGDGYRLEVWDFLVGPGRSTDSVSLPGAAVFEARECLLANVTACRLS